VTTVALLRDFVVNELHWDENGEPLTPDYPLIENHVVDSLGLLILLTFIEERFDVQIDDEELIPENFDTIGAIARLIERKMAQR